MILRSMVVLAWALALAVVFAGRTPAASGRRDVVAGPVAASVRRVVDGDTLVIRARIWLGQTVETTVRVAGIDAPERRGRCPRERALARRATDRLKALLADGAAVLRDVRHGKYAGRVLARVATPAGADVGAILVREGLARPYRGGRRRGWCPR
jgi:micrococcal nuclease